MIYEHHRVEKGADPSSLLSPDLVERSPILTQLKQKFSAQLPNRFGNARVYISPVSFMHSALRADCQNSGCGIRAYIHIKRETGEWIIIENSPQFDRTNNNPCSECLNALSK